MGKVIPSPFSPFPFQSSFFLLAHKHSIAIAELASSAAMGNKPGVPKSKRGGKEKTTDADDLGLKRVDRDWSKSSVKTADLDDLREKKLLPPLEQLKTRAPGKEVIPSPRNGERVCFVDFLHMGFSPPFMILSAVSCMPMGFRCTI